MAFDQCLLNGPFTDYNRTGRATCQAECGRCGWNRKVAAKRKLDEPQRLPNGLIGYVTRKEESNGAQRN